MLQENHLSTYQVDKCVVSQLQVFWHLIRPSSFWMSRQQDLIRAGRKEIMELVHPLHERENLTTILVTHSMEDAARYADNVIVMHDGHSVMAGTPEEVFSDEEKLATYRLGLPRSVQFQRNFEKMIGRPLPNLALTEEKVAEAIAQAAYGRRWPVMLEKMIFGRYIPGSSFVHKLDPRSKLSFVFLFIIAVFLANNAVTYGLLLGFTLFVIFVSRIRLYFLINGLKPIIFLIIFTFLMHISFYKRRRTTC